MAADNAKQMLHGKQDPKIIAILKPEKDSDSKELQTNIPLGSYVQTLRKNDTEHNSTNHRTTLN